MFKPFDLDRQLREKAKRLANDAKRKLDVDEATQRLKFGKETLTAILEGEEATQQVLQRARSSGNESVGKLTETFLHLAPVLEKDPGKVTNAIASIDAANLRIESSAKIHNVAGPLEGVMNDLLAGMPRNVPRNVLEDLQPENTVAEQREQAPQDVAKPTAIEPSTHNHDGNGSIAKRSSGVFGKLIAPINNLVDTVDEVPKTVSKALPNASTKSVDERPRTRSWLSKLNANVSVDQSLTSLLGNRGSIPIGANVELDLDLIKHDQVSRTIDKSIDATIGDKLDLVNQTLDAGEERLGELIDGDDRGPNEKTRTDKDKDKDKDKDTDKRDERGKTKGKDKEPDELRRNAEEDADAERDDGQDLDAAPNRSATGKQQPRLTTIPTKQRDEIVDTKPTTAGPTPKTKTLDKLAKIAMPTLKLGKLDVSYEGEGTIGLGLGNWVVNLDLDGEGDVPATPDGEVEAPTIKTNVRDENVETKPGTEAGAASTSTTPTKKTFRRTGFKSTNKPPSKKPIKLASTGTPETSAIVTQGKQDAAAIKRPETPAEKPAEPVVNKIVSPHTTPEPPPTTNTDDEEEAGPRKRGGGGGWWQRRWDQLRGTGRAIQAAATLDLAKNASSTTVPIQALVTQGLEQTKAIVDAPPRVVNIEVEPTMQPSPLPEPDKITIPTLPAPKQDAIVPTLPEVVPITPVTTVTPTTVDTKTTTPATTPEGLIVDEELVLSGAGQAIKSAPREEVPALADEQERAVREAAKRAQTKIQADKAQQDRNEQRRRQRAGVKGKRAGGKAQGHTRGRQQKARRGGQSALAQLKQTFAKYKADQEASLAKLLTDGKTSLGLQFKQSEDKQLEALTKGAQALVDAKKTEKIALDARLKREEELERNNFTKACAERLTKSNEIKAEHTRIKNEAVRDANRICTERCREFFDTGEKQASEAISTANREANGLLEQGRAAASAAASRARSGLGEDATEAQRRSAGNAASKAEMARWQKQASDRRAKGRDDAKTIRADYKAKAEQQRLDTKDVIRGHEDNAKREHDLEDVRYKADLVSLEKTRDAAMKHFESVRTEFDKAAQVEIDAYHDWAETQKALIQTTTQNELRAAVADLEKDHAEKIEGVKTFVNGKLSEMETKINGATNKQVAGLQKEFDQLRKDINGQVATVLERSFGRAQAYSKQADTKVEEINIRAEQAVNVIRTEARMVANERIEGAKKQAKSNRDGIMRNADDRARESFDRQKAQAINDNLTKLEAGRVDPAKMQEIVSNNEEVIKYANATETIRAGRDEDPARLSKETLEWQQVRKDALATEAKESSLTRRQLKTGQEAITDTNSRDAIEKRTEVLSSLLPTDIEGLNGKADPGKAIATLATLTRDELLTMYPEGEMRDRLLEAAERAGCANTVRGMLGLPILLHSNSNEPPMISDDPRAIALHWARKNGDKRVADAIFNTMTTDKERASLDASFQKLGNKPIRDAFENLPEKDRKELAVSWDAGRTYENGTYSRTDGDDLVTQWNKDKSRREAMETLSTYSSADKNKLLQLRSEMYKRHAGPYMDAADEKRHQEQLQRELEEFDSTAYKLSGESLETLDRKNTTGKVQEALLSTSRRVQVDPYDPDSTRPEGNWNQFGTKLMERSIEKNAYDTRLAEGFLRNIPAEKRRDFLANYEKENKRTFVDDVNANVRTSAAAPTPDGGTRSVSRFDDVRDLGPVDPNAKVPASEIDADALISIAETGEVPDALRMIQLKNGRGRGDEADQKEYGNTIDRVTAGKDYQTLAAQYAELNQKYQLPSTGDGTNDLVRDANKLLKPRDARAAEFELRNPGERTPEWWKKRSDAIYVDDTWLPQGMREALEGPAGQEVASQKKRLDEQYEQMVRDGTANLTAEQIRQRLEQGGDPPPFTQEQLETYATYSEGSKAVTSAYDTMKTQYEDNVRYAAQFAATGVVVVGTIVLTGPLGPVAAGVISGALGGLTTLGIKQISFGSDYSAKEFDNDAKGIIVDAIIGAGTGAASKAIAAGVNVFANRLATRYGAQYATQLLADAIVDAGGAVTGDLAKALLDPDTYVGNDDQIRERLLNRVKKTAKNALITSAVKRTMTTAKGNAAGGDTAISVIGNTAGSAATADSAAEVLMSALGGLGAMGTGRAGNKGAKGAKVSDDTRLVTTSMPRKAGATTSTSDSGDVRYTNTQSAEVLALRSAAAQQAKILPRNTVDDVGRRVYDVELPDGTTYVIKGPVTGNPKATADVSDAPVSTKPKTKAKGTSDDDVTSAPTKTKVTDDEPGGTQPKTKGDDVATSTNIKTNAANDNDAPKTKLDTDDADAPKLRDDEELDLIAQRSEERAHNEGDGAIGSCTYAALQSAIQAEQRGWRAEIVVVQGQAKTSSSDASLGTDGAGTGTKGFGHAITAVTLPDGTTHYISWGKTFDSLEAVMASSPNIVSWQVRGRRTAYEQTMQLLNENGYVQPIVPKSWILPGDKNAALDPDPDFTVAEHPWNFKGLSQQDKTKLMGQATALNMTNVKPITIEAYTPAGAGLGRYLDKLNVNGVEQHFESQGIRTRYRVTVVQATDTTGTTWFMVRRPNGTMDKFRTLGEAAQASRLGDRDYWPVDSVNKSGGGDDGTLEAYRAHQKSVNTPSKPKLATDDNEPPPIPKPTTDPDAPPPIPRPKFGLDELKAPGKPKPGLDELSTLPRRRDANANDSAPRVTTTPSKTQASDKSLDAIRTGIPGEIRSEAELSTKDVVDVMNDQLARVTSEEVDAITNMFPPAQRALAQEVLARASGFGNIESVSSLFDAIQALIPSVDPHKVKLFTPGSGSLADNLSYMSSKQSFSTDGKRPKIMYPALTLEPNCVVILDSVILARIKSDPEFARSLVDNHAVLLDPVGFNDGINMFNAGTQGKLAQRTKQIVDRVSEILKDRPELSAGEATKLALDESRKQAFDAVAANDPALAATLGSRIKRIDPSEVVEQSSQGIANQLNGKTGLTTDKLQAILDQVDPADQPYLRELLAQQSQIYSARTQANAIEAQHSQLMAMAAQQGIPAENVYFLLPMQSKSFGMVAMAHREATGTPVGRYLNSASEIGKLNLGKNSMVVILDDVSGSGTQLTEKAGDTLATGYKGKLVLAPMTATTAARDHINKHLGDAVTFAPGRVETALKNSPFYTSLPPEQQAHLKMLLGDLGFDNNGLMTAFPYMSPDNNSAFAANVAKHFIMNDNDRAAKRMAPWEPKKKSP